jgi:threonine/homoserine/homoserine lactone efflux protein
MVQFQREIFRNLFILNLKRPLIFVFLSSVLNASLMETDPREMKLILFYKLVVPLVLLSMAVCFFYLSHPYAHVHPKALKGKTENYKIC